METKFKGTTEQWVLDGELLMTKYSEMVIADFYPITEYTSISDIDFSQTRANMLLASKSLDLLNEKIDFEHDWYFQTGILIKFKIKR